MFEEFRKHFPRFSKWTAKWGWGVLLGTSYALEEGHEYGIALAFVVLAVASLAASIFHWGGIENYPKLTLTARISGYAFALILFCVAALYIVGEGHGRPWSRMPEALASFQRKQSHRKTTEPTAIEKPVQKTEENQPVTATVEHRATKTTPARKKINLPNLKLLDLFKTDFAENGGLTDVGMDLQVGTETVHVGRRLITDFNSKSEFAAFYVPATEHEAAVCMALADIAKPFVANFASKLDITSGDSENVTSIHDLAFSGRVFIYHEWPLTNLEKAEIIQKFARNGLDVQFRGIEYLAPKLKAPIAGRQPAGSPAGLGARRHTF